VVLAGAAVVGFGAAAAPLVAVGAAPAAVGAAGAGAPPPHADNSNNEVPPTAVRMKSRRYVMPSLLLFRHDGIGREPRRAQPRVFRM
jgi:hypothetical protein